MEFAAAMSKTCSGLWREGGLRDCKCVHTMLQVSACDFIKAKRADKHRDYRKEPL